MTKATQLDPGRHEATERTIERLRAGGWDVVVRPGPDELPEALSDLQPDLVAHRGDEHAVVEVKSRLAPPNLDLVTLAERVASLPGWRLELVYIPDEPAVAEPAQLRRWASTASELAGSSPEAALLLSWAALEGLLHQLAQQRGVDTNQAGSLLAALASLGVLDDDEHDRLRRAMTARNALAHGRQGPPIEAAHIRELSQLAGRFADRAEDEESGDRSPAST
ncbi:hypothetical protein [Blastococcus xanthinilyticus]|uniref:hypothetical protein n=1 Tax=Blastococcus xanthinilyticus TaxID=1564164 RepID=UPI0014125253|nr:hypothetical protein [Blastococcus xanthinilyticus]